MKRATLLIALAVVATTALAGCSDELLDELGVSAEDREGLEEFEEFAQDLADELSEAGSDGGGAAGNDGAQGDQDQPPVDPNWSPPGFPPPPGQPTESNDYTDSGSCPAGRECGWATYDDDNGEAARDYYEDWFGRPPDQETTSPSRNGQGEEYEAVTSTWSDADTEVTVYTDHHGTDVHVQADSSPG